MRDSLDEEPERVLAGSLPTLAGEKTKPVAKPAVANRAHVTGYEILLELGRGGMGVVYKARQVALNRIVALKMVLAAEHAGAEGLARFRIEAEAVARLQHPNIVQIHEVGEQDGRPFFSLEFVEGGNLEDKMGGGPQPPRKAAQLVEQLARAMQFAHERHIIHRDLKPANVLLTADGTPKITDFGLAKRLDSQGQTKSGDIMGTPSYMAPEQAASAPDIGPPADIYALGAVLYDLLVGRPPFRAVTSMDTILQVLSEEPVPPRRLQSKVPRDLETICLKCLEKQPHKRYAGAGALADDLDRFLAHEPIQARPAGAGERLVKWVRRRPARAALLAVSLLALVLLIGGALWYTRRLQAELERTEAAQRETKATERDLHVALTRQVASSVDGDLRQLATVPQTMARLMALRGDWQDQQLDGWLRAAMQVDPRIFGLYVGFEPFGFSSDRQDYCLYTYRRGPSFITKDLSVPEYQPPYRARGWYRDARQQASWIEPYIGEGGDRTPMVSYSVPFFRAGKVAGVVGADLSIAYFKALRDQLLGLRLGEDNYCFMLSAGGTLLYHPDRDYEFPAARSHLDRIAADASFLALVRLMREQDTGAGEAVDFRTGKPATFLFSRVPSLGWLFVVVIPEQ